MSDFTFTGQGSNTTDGTQVVHNVSFTVANSTKAYQDSVDLTTSPVTLFTVGTEAGATVPSAKFASAVVENTGSNPVRLSRISTSGSTSEEIATGGFVVLTSLKIESIASAGSFSATYVLDSVEASSTTGTSSVRVSVFKTT